MTRVHSRRSRVLLSGVLILLMLVCQHATGTYLKVQTETHNMAMSKAFKQLQHMVAELKARGYDVENMDSLPEFDMPRSWHSDDVSLVEIPDYDHMQYENEEHAEEFGLIPDGDINKMPAWEREAYLEARHYMPPVADVAFLSEEEQAHIRHQWSLSGAWNSVKSGVSKAASSVTSTVGRGARWVGRKATDVTRAAVDMGREAINDVSRAVRGKDQISEACECITDRNIGLYKAKDHVFTDECRDWDGSGKNWCYIKNARSCTQFKSYPSKQHTGEFYRYCEEEAEQRTCTEGEGTGPVWDALKLLGVPKDGLYEHHQVYFSWSPDTQKWSWSTKKEIGGSSWKPVSEYTGPATARDVAATLDNENPMPIASPDVQEVLGCATNGIYEYDAGIGVSELYFQFNGVTREWQWSPDKQHWMPTATTVVKGGKYNGKRPVISGRDVIDALEVFTVTGMANLPTGFGTNWLVREAHDRISTTIENIRAKIQEAKSKIVEFKRKVVEFKRKMQSGELDWNAFKARWGEVADQFKQFASKGENYKAMGLAVIYGLLNGVLMGMMDMMKDTANSCPNKNQMDDLSSAFSAMNTSIADFFGNFSLSRARSGFLRVCNAIKEFLKTLYEFVKGCPALKATLGIIIVVILIGFILNVILVATGYGAVFKVVLAVVGLIFAIPFIFGKLKQFFSGVVALGSAKGEDFKKAILSIVESVASLVGCIIGIIFLVKTVKNQGPQAMKQLANGKLGKFFGLAPDEVASMGPKAAEFTAAVQGAQQGTKPTGGLLKAVASTGDDAARLGDDAARVGDDAARVANTGDDAARLGDDASRLSDDAARTANTADDAARTADDAARTGDDAARTADDAARAADDTASVMKRDAKLQQARMKDPSKLVGKVADAKAARPLSATQNADDLARFNAGKKPSWAGKEPGGLRGSGPPGQKVFWDAKAKCWRHGPKSVDPLTGKSLSGQPAAVENGRIVVDLCKVNAQFCAGPKPNFCKAFPALCGSGKPGQSLPDEVTGMGRSRMPQVGKDKDFLTFLTKSLGRRVRMKTRGPNGENLKWVDPNKLTPTQMEINMGKTVGIGDSIATKARPPPRYTLVSRDGYIIDGHHRWSGYKMAAAQGAELNAGRMPVRVVDADIAEIIGATSKALKSVSVTLPDGSTATKWVSTVAKAFSVAGMLEMSAKTGVTRARVRRTWKEAMTQHLAANGMFMDDQQLNELFDVQTSM
jgi:hypothetical protein